MAPALSARDLRTAIDASLRSLRARRAGIDAANVFPVHDSDTGTNLVMTFESVARALDAAAGDGAVPEAVKAGARDGARGNAGLIAAQILRGLAGAWDDGPADAAALSSAFRRACDLAYDAVLEPAEGTILTVMRAAADAAAGPHPDPSALLAAATAAAHEALQRTPEQLEVLARAGVVDAGAMGLVAVLEAFARTASGEAAPDEPEQAPPPVRDLGDGSATYAWEVQYLITAPPERIPPLRALLGTLGDSVVVIGEGTTWRVHVHTDERERALAIGRAVGDTSDEEVTGLREPAAPAGEPPARSPGSHEIPLAKPATQAALIAVCAGAGVEALFAQLGARVVRGGHGVPLTADALEAVVDEMPFDHVIVLPNGDDPFSRAWEVAERSSKRVTVLRTHDMAAGLAAAAAYGDARSADAALGDMREVLERVRTGQVVLSPTAMQTEQGPVAPGQSVGFVDGALEVVENDPVVAAGEVAAKLEGTLITVLCGEGVGEQERTRLAEGLRRALPSVTLEIHDGGQPVHRYLMAAE